MNNKPHGVYEFCCDVTSTIYGFKDREAVLFQDFECSIEVDVDPNGLDVVTVTDVLVGVGLSLKNGDALAQAIRLQVMEKAEAAIRDGNGPWDEIKEDFDLVPTGPAGSPDAGWRYA